MNCKNKVNCHHYYNKNEGMISSQLSRQLSDLAFSFKIWRLIYALLSSTTVTSSSALATSLSGFLIVFLGIVFFFFCVCGWLSKGNLRTKDKLLEWGVISNATYDLCNQENESLQHLFYSCPFSRSVWLQVSSLWNVSQPYHYWKT